MLLVEKHVREGDRVLVLNGSGGVGAHLVQMLKPNGASYVVATSTQRELLEGLGVDRVLDHSRNENWWEVAEFQDEPFDLVIDLWGTREPYRRAVVSPAVKTGYQGGRYITTVGDTQNMVLMNCCNLFPLAYDMMARSCWTSCCRCNPRYEWFMGLEPDNGNLERLLAMVEDGKLKAVLDSTHRFTAAGVQGAFHVQKGRHAHGKVVIIVANK